MTKQDIIDYVLDSPQNTNKAVLNSILNQFEEAVATAAATEADANDPVAEAITITENGTTNAPEGTVYNKVTVNVPAPVSDFSTAQVTIVDNAGGHSFYGPFLTEEHEDINSATLYSADIVTEETSPLTRTIVLYKGKAIISFTGTVSVGCTGNATSSGISFSAKPYAVVTGDATITINSIDAQE